MVETFPQHKTASQGRIETILAKALSPEDLLDAFFNQALPEDWGAVEVSPEQLRQRQAMRRKEYRRLFNAEAAKAAAGSPPSKARASELLLLYHDSYSRLPELMRFAPIMTRRSWLALLGEEWSTLDNLYDDWGKLLRMLLPRRPTLLMMDEDERAAWRALPNVVTVYRGCSEVNRDGLSWTLSREVAARFPTQLERYKPPPGYEPLLLTGEVAKGRITAVKLGRKEQEVIALQVRVTAVEAL